jgi:HK97 family phage major capsid protein
MPRLTSPTTATMSPENTNVTPTTIKTGQVTLRAKKAFCVVVMPGELLRFGGAIVEMLVRNDMMKTVALLMDYLLLFGGSVTGGASDVTPLGLQTMMNNALTAANGGLFSAPSAGVPGVSGYGNPIIGPSAANQISGQDVYDFISTILANNGEPNAFIVNPRLFYALRKVRWQTFSGSGQVGGFLFNFTRDTDGRPVWDIDGLKVVQTAQVPTNLSTPGGSQGNLTTLFCGDFPTAYIIGLFGAIEFAQEAGGIQLFGADQVAVRALASFDGAPRYPGLISGLRAADYTGLTVA